MLRHPLTLPFPTISVASLLSFRSIASSEKIAWEHAENATAASYNNIDLLTKEKLLRPQTPFCIHAVLCSPKCQPQTSLKCIITHYVIAKQLGHLDNARSAKEIWNERRGLKRLHA
jgi:hypothetical protein